MEDGWIIFRKFRLKAFLQVSSFTMLLSGKYCTFCSFYDILHTRQVSTISYFSAFFIKFFSYAVLLYNRARYARFSFLEALSLHGILFHSVRVSKIKFSLIRRQPIMRWNQTEETLVFHPSALLHYSTKALVLPVPVISSMLEPRILAMISPVSQYRKKIINII